MSIVWLHKQLPSQSTGGGFQNTDNTVFCSPGEDISEVYAAAAALTPNETPLSDSNRATMIVLPGLYTVQENFDFNNDNVNVLGLTGNPADVKITPSVGDTIYFTASNVDVMSLSFGSNRLIVGDNNATQTFERVIALGDRSFSGKLNAVGLVSGTFIECVGGPRAFGMHAAGTFIRCTAGNNSFAFNSGCTLSGRCEDCETSGSGFGYGGTVSGECVRCKASEAGFAANGGTISGQLIDCVAGTNTSYANGGGSVTGTLIQCRLGIGTYVAPTAPGYYRNCVDGNGDVYNETGV